jgi:hypothetical protein
MQRIISIFIAAIGGGTGGYAAHQFLGRKDDPTLNQQIVIGAPLTVLVGATLLGLLGGRNGPIVAFVTGFVGATLLGTRLNDAIPGVVDARSRVRARLDQDAPAD